MESLLWMRVSASLNLQKVSRVSPWWKCRQHRQGCFPRQNCLLQTRPQAGGAERPRRPGAGPAPSPTHCRVAWTPALPPTALQSCLASSLVRAITGNMVTSSSWNLEFYIVRKDSRGKASAQTGESPSRQLSMLSLPTLSSSEKGFPRSRCTSLATKRIFAKILLVSLTFSLTLSRVRRRLTRSPCFAYRI